MDLAGAGQFPPLAAAPRGPPSRPGKSDSPVPQRGGAEPGSTGRKGGDPSHLDLPHRVRADQPDLGQRAPDRQGLGREAAAAGGTRRKARARVRRRL